MKYIAKIEKIDGRTKSGLRLVEKIPFSCEEVDLKKTKRSLAVTYPKRSGYRIEVYEAEKVVYNLLSGKPVTIATDTPRCCDPSSELYWSM